MDSNRADIAKDIFFIPTEDAHKNTTWSSKSANTAKTQVS